jgi:hypothetical protein
MCSRARWRAAPLPRATMKDSLDKDALEGQDLATVHELTYTIETAPAKINAELTALAETLEEVHIASETADIGTVKTKGHEYLSVASEVMD